MTNREEQILNMIKLNPMISQKELSDKLGITRSSVAVHITNLMKKGYIKGKGYIFRSDDYVVVLGGSNIDITGFSKNKLVLNDSNPGKVEISLGGVARNIAENLSRLNTKVKLITALGDDVYGNKILDECRLYGIDMNDTFISKNYETSVYLSTLDQNGDMKVAISSMDIMNEISIDFIKSKSNIIKNSKLLVLDTNINEEVINYIVNNFDVDIFIDTVSSIKAMKIKNLIRYFHTIKLNKIEAEKITNTQLKDESDLDKAGNILIESGVKRVFITLGEDGVYYKDCKCSDIIKSKPVNVVNATGAGDAFMSALTYSYINNIDIKETVKIAMSASILALSHENTINPNMSIENIYKTMKEMMF